ncbi:hypothetical protein PHYBOEH_003786 [Phytophthora boehmeriae]|uniref:Ion transport domain-containing protein n=1 Tax=Phytophthora boehmeriae TaxID=109152 RepID=A0A8T1WNA0_9STRA|nr:hypothetical protein PHYBOEH_003786 [Phytophthora boehmeriae]
MKTPPQQRARSYNEHSALLSSPTPSHWRRYHLHGHRTTLRQDVWTVLRFRSSVQHRSGLQFASYVLELSILTLILLNVVVAISDSAVMVQSPPSEGSSAAAVLTSDWSQTFLLISTIIFSIEYALRLWSCVEDERFSNGAILGRLKWMTRPLSLIDLLALIPFYVELSIELGDDPPYRGGLTLRSLRLLRVIAFLRLERMYNAMKNLRVIFARKKEEFMVVSYLTALLVLTASLMIFFLEHKAQPKVFSSFAVCAWWSIETITSLGYGDVVPVTGLGRLLGAMLALWGIVLFTIPGAVLGSGFIEVMLEKQREEEAEMYSMAMGKGTSINSNSPLFVGDFSDGEQHEQREVSGPQYEAVEVATPSAHSPHSIASSTARVAAALQVEALHQKVETIAAGQRHLEVQFQTQQKQLERLTRLVETALAVSATTAATAGASP